MSEMLYAEDVGHYWKTGKSDPSRWIERAKQQIEEIDGTVLAEGYGSEIQTGRAAYMLAFKIAEDSFKLMWPVLPSKNRDTVSAKRQAATMLYHHVKAACMSALVLGARTAFFAHLMLPDGRTAGQATAPELLEMLPRMLVTGGSR